MSKKIFGVEMFDIEEVVENNEIERYEMGEEI